MLRGMSWDGAEAEGVARWLYDRAGADLDDPPDPLDLADALGVNVEYARGDTIGQDGTLSRIDGRWTVQLSRSAPVERARFALGHELGEWACRRRIEPEIEALCDAISAAVLLPRPALLAALRHFGDDLPALARAFRVTETCAALRVGEVTGRPMLLVSPGLVRARGEAYGWPTDSEVRRQMRSGELPGLRSCRLGDDRRRTWLVVG